jgi:hypothetical protein
MGRPYHRPIKLESPLFSPRADERLRAAQSNSHNRRVRKSLTERVGDWPPYSPGSLNAWLLLVTTKPPNWRDPLVLWPEAPLSLGEPHEGFFYPDPLGFWAEVRRWVLELFRAHHRTFGMPDALALTTLLHLEDEPDRFLRARDLSQPRTILFLDEPSLERVALTPVRREQHFIPDPHRKGQVYEGFWGWLEDGVVVGKAPQHPAMHRLYPAADMAGFLRAAPPAEGG